MASIITTAVAHNDAIQSLIQFTVCFFSYANDLIIQRCGTLL